MKITRQKLTAILIMAFLIAVSLTAAAMAAAIGKITAFEGNVDILRRGQERAAPVMRVEEPVSEGDIVRTKSNGKAEITFTDNSVIRLAPGTRLQITEYLMEGNKRKSGVMNLFRGKVRAVVSKSRGFLGVAFGGGNRFEVRTPTAVAGVKGTDFFVFYNMGVTGIVVTDGKVDTFNPQFPNQVVPVSAGSATFIAGDKPPSAPRPANDVEVIRHTHDTDPGEKPKEGDSTITTDAGGPPAGGTFGYEAPGGTPPPTDTGGFAGSPLISSSDVYTDLLSDTTPPVVSIAGDTTSPVVSIAGPSPYTNLSTAAFTVTYDEPVTATYTMGSWGATATATTSDTFSIASLPEGSYTLTVTATDAAGNVSTQTYSWTTDYTAPVVTTAASPDPSGATTSIITFTGSDPSAVYSYSIDGVVLTNQTSILSGLADGNHILDYTATDPAGNTTTGTLSFLLSNSTITGLASGTGSILTGTSTGTVTGVYGQNWGGWTTNINGSYTGLSSSSWQLVSGGAGSGAQNGYWIDNTTGAYSENIMSGTSNLTYLTYTTLGTGVGTISGSYDLATFSLTEAGSFTETPLAFVSDAYANLYYWNSGYWANDYGALNGLLGGTQSLWSGGGIPVTFMGGYSPSTTQPHMFLDTYLSSYNYINSTNTTYDNGAYYGFTAGAEINNVMDARLYALYIDPTGTAGYLKSSDLSGIVYPDIQMFEMNGTIDRSQMTTGTGLTAGQLYGNIWISGGGEGTLSGAFEGTGGSIDGYDNGLYTYSIVNFVNNTAERWGIYNQEFAGSFTNPDANTSWMAKLGGYDSMGAVNPYMSYDGSYTYVDGGSYYYNYYSNNGYGYQYYYRPNLTQYYITYSSDGTTYTYDYNTGIGTYGTWDPQTYNVSSLATPIDSGNATPSYSYGSLNGSDDYGYWIADATGAWGGDKLTASVVGKYLTPYKMGNITGEMLGTYNTTDDVWQGVNMGAYDGTPLDFSGNVYGGLLWYDPATYPGVLRYANTIPTDQTWNVNGIIGGIGNPWTTGSANVYLMGTYSAYSGAEPYLVYGSGWHINYDPTVSGSSSTIGGAFSGYTVGLWNNGAINTKTLAIYIDPNGNAGYLSGPLSGNYYSGVNMWEMSGNLSTEFVGTTNILPADLSASLYTGGFGWNNMTGDFGGSGGISSTYFEGSLKGLFSDHHWGIWNSGMGGSYTGQSGTNMLAQFGGSNFFYPEYYYGYMLGDIASNDWGIYGNTFSGSMNANYLNYYFYGAMTGDIVGTFDGTYWQAAGIGKWDAQPLSFSGNIYGDYYYYDDYSDYLYFYDSKYGIFGATTSPYLGTPVTLYAMGEAWPSGYITWWNSIEGNNYVDMGSHWYGWLGGTTNPVTNAEKGMLKALYIDNAGNAGILTGDFAGNYYPGINNMWEAQGTLTANQKVAAGVYDPALFGNYVDYSYPDGYAYGKFAGNTGYIELGAWLQWIYYDETATYWFVNPTTGNPEPWGVYKLELGGYYDNPSPASTFSMALGGYDWKGYWTGDTDYWLAHITDGNWNSDQTIDGTVTGRYLTPYALGTISGKMLGSYDTYTGGTWEGVAMGEFTETPLSYGSSLYSSLYTDNNIDGSISAVIGGTDPSFAYNATNPVTMMGTYSPGSNLHTWYSSIQDSVYGQVQGVIGGTVINDAFDARVYTIYKDWSGGAGFMTLDTQTSPPVWNTYPSIGMFTMDGTLNRTEVTTNNALYYSDFWWAQLQSGASGTFSDSNSTISGSVVPNSFSTVSLNSVTGYTGPGTGTAESPLVGVYYNQLGGGFSSPLSDGWSANMGGQASFGAKDLSINYNGDYYYYPNNIYDGYYSYSYNTSTMSGYKVDFRPSAVTGYSTSYNPDGTTWINTYTYNTTTGGWDYAVSGPGSRWDLNPSTLIALSTPTDLSYSSQYDYPYMYGGAGTNEANGYYIMNVGGTGSSTWNGNKLTATATGRFLTPYKTGTMTGELLGTYTGTTSGTWQAVNMGTYEGTPLAWSGSVYDSSFITVTGGVAYADGDITGLLGGTTSLWGSSPSFIAMGTYSNPINKTLWTADMMGTTTDGASFQTITRGITLNDIVEGRTSAIYIKSDGAGGYLAGYLTGDITGTFYPGISMWETAGNLTAVDMGSTSILPSGLSTPYYSSNPSFKFNDSLGGTITGDISGTNRLRNISLIDQDWGIWFSWNDGIYSFTPPTNWSMTSEKIDLNYITGTQTSGTVWGSAINMLAGTTYGYGADIITAIPKTWISVGETIGTFDPVTFTWQAVQTGAWLETNKFLAMAAAGDTTGALAALNIPFVEVGRATLIGSGNGFTDLRMTDTIFFADNISAAPKIWATGSVTGSFTAPPATGTDISLRGGPLNAAFAFQTWDVGSGKWISTVNGTGGYNGSTTFSGAAAGTGAATSVGGISGTAAGTAK